MKKTSEIEKKSFINNVIGILDRSEKYNEIRLIKKQSDLTKMYKRAQSFVRENRQIFEGVDLYKTDEIRFEKNDKGLYDNDIVGETDEKFLSEIYKCDNSIEVKRNDADRGRTNLSHLIKLFFDKTEFKIKREFINKLDIKKELIGYKNGNEVYYSEEFNSLYEIV